MVEQGSKKDAVIEGIQGGSTISIRDKILVIFMDGRCSGVLMRIFVEHLV